MRRLWAALIYVLILWNVVRGVGNKQCPDPISNPFCQCYEFENGIYLECPAATAQTLKMLFEIVKAPVQFLSVYEPDKSLTKLPKNIFQESTQIRYIQISQSNIEELHDDSLRPLKLHLESFGLVSAHLKKIPQKAFKGLSKLIAVDLEDNEISEIPNYTFYGLKLVKLSLKGNLLESIMDYSFAGLEATISELDISENKLKRFPTNALQRLEKLLHLRLSFNNITSIPSDVHTPLSSLIFLDLSFNNFQVTKQETFKICLAIRTLSLYYNRIEKVDGETFTILKDLETLDLGHNKIVYLTPQTFKENRKIRSIDLSHNHLHKINGVFATLPNLKELFLSDNNILEILFDDFNESINLSVIFMQDNAIARIDTKAFSTLLNLTQLHLSSNFISFLPRDIFSYNYNLTSISLDRNWLVDIEPGTFDKAFALKELKLSHNRIQCIHKDIFKSLPELLELHLQYNEISTIDKTAFSSLKSLQHINLQYNLFSNLDDVFPQNLTTLLSLQLDYNIINKIDNNTFKGLSNVQILYLRNNRLQKIQRVIFKDLEHIQKVYLNNNSIQDVEDKAFDSMRFLKFLDLSLNYINQITVKTFAALHELEELNLSQNRISKIESNSFINLKRLRKLDLSFNPLKLLHNSIFQEGLLIRILSLVNCSISKIEPGAFRGLNNLNDLNLVNNKLSVHDLRFLNIPGLRILNLAHNNLSNLDDKALNNLPSLQVISLKNCAIGKLLGEVFIKNKNLIQIDLSWNNLKEIPTIIFAQLNILKELKLNFNHLSQLPYLSLLNISTMETFSISHNKLNALELYQLNGMPNLKYLNFGYNSISGMTGFSLTNLHQLLSVDLAGNKLSTLPANFFHNSKLLREVDLSGNRFQHIPNAALSEITLPKLRCLNVSRNPIINMHDNGPVRRYAALEDMYLQYSDLVVITSKEFELFPSLLHAYLSNNKILKISPGAFSSLNYLITLDIGVNQIQIIPQERLYGLNNLRILNVTQNILKDLDEFPQNMKSLQILDISYNRITRIRKSTFVYLSNLAELYLSGNWISSIAPEAFRPFNKLRTLDISKNFMEHMPLEAFKSLETQISNMRTEDNPLVCACDSEDLWEWYKNHQKQMKESKPIKCESPKEAKGKVFIKLDPGQFCDQPIVVKLIIKDIQPFSVTVSWQGRNRSGLHGYQVVYYSLDITEEIRGYILDQSAHSLKLKHLYPGIKYHICVLSLGPWISAHFETASESRLIARKTPSATTVTYPKQDGFKAFPEDILPLLIDSATSRCTEVLTLGIPDLDILTDNSMSVQSILTRRLGLIVGCCLGFVVFTCFISILGYFKVKKQRCTSNSNQPTVPPEYMSYSQFSIQSGEPTEGSGQSHFITGMSDTTIFN